MAQTALLDSTVKLLRRLPLFQEVPEQDLLALAQHFRLDFFERDAVIFYQGGCLRPHLAGAQRTGEDCAP